MAKKQWYENTRAWKRSRRRLTRKLNRQYKRACKRGEEHIPFSFFDKVDKICKMQKTLQKKIRLSGQA